MNFKFKEIRQQRKQTFQELADALGYTRTEIYQFELGILSDREKKEQIIRSLSTLTGHDYHLSDFELVLPSSVDELTTGTVREGKMV